MSSGKNFADVVRSVYVTQLFSLNSEVEKSSFVLIVVLAIENPFHALSIDNISGQLGCSPATLTRSIARFKTLAGLNSAGGVRFIRPGAGLSNGDKPATVQSVGNIPEEPALIAR
jgi:hypothetical protein